MKALKLGRLHTSTTVALPLCLIRVLVTQGTWSAASFPFSLLCSSSKTPHLPIHSSTPSLIASQQRAGASTSVDLTRCWLLFHQSCHHLRDKPASSFYVLYQKESCGICRRSFVTRIPGTPCPLYCNPGMVYSCPTSPFSRTSQSISMQSPSALDSPLQRPSRVLQSSTPRVSSSARRMWWKASYITMISVIQPISVRNCARDSSLGMQGRATRVHRWAIAYASERITRLS